MISPSFKTLAMPESSKRVVSPPPIKRRRLDEAQPVHLAPSIPPRPITKLPANQFRIFSWNVNGISPFLQPSIKSYFKTSPSKRQRTPSTDEEPAEHSLSQCLKRWEYPQVVGLQEIKVRPGDEQTMTSIRRAVKASKSLLHGYRAFFSLPRDKHNATGFHGKVYGVAMLVRDDILDSDVSVTDVPWDLEGRVLVLKIPRRKLAVCNIYAVNGTDNPWRHSESGAIIGSRHDKKRLFHTQLREAVFELEAAGWSVIVAGDLNIARSPIDGFPGIRLAPSHVQNRADFETKFMTDTEGSTAMIDTFRHLHGNERKYSYRGRNVQWGASCDRVDLILASDAAGEAIVEADVLDTVFERGPSDHVPIYVTLDLEKLGTEGSDAKELQNGAEQIND